MANSVVITDEMHRQMAADVRSQIEPLREKLRELEAVERFHLIQAGETLIEANGRSAPANKAEKLARDAMWHDATAFALRGLGRPAKVAELADYVSERGYRSGITRRKLYNALFVALRRRKDLFEPAGEALWRLKE